MTKSHPLIKTDIYRTIVAFRSMCKNKNKNPVNQIFRLMKLWIKREKRREVKEGSGGRTKEG
jgi:hypothetical protein